TTTKHKHCKPTPLIQKTNNQTKKQKVYTNLTKNLKNNNTTTHTTCIKINFQTNTNHKQTNTPNNKRKKSIII
ncbi:hypothetical protein, partial [Klebsiella pneumoniae]|uniref:hypothetical protein n=1 Tax=Klebsiella pneumoniae TaxID=573 RepID=UPI0039C3930B